MYKPTRFLIAGLLLALLTSACTQLFPSNNEKTLQGEITVSGAFALYPLMITWADEFQEIHPGVEFEISSGGAGKGMEDIFVAKFLP